MADFPKKVTIFSVSWDNVGQEDEDMIVSWNYAAGIPAPAGSKRFRVGTECFLESPTSITQVPEDQLIASLSMMAILAGAIPGTKEFDDAVSNQSTMNFQTIIGTAKLKNPPEPVDDPTIGPQGTVFDFTFQKSSAGTPTKVVRMDGWNASQYSQRVNSIPHMYHAIPGAIYKEFPTFKKSNLGAVDSANRQAVEAFLPTRFFWV